MERSERDLQLSRLRVKRESFLVRRDRPWVVAGLIEPLRLQVLLERLSAFVRAGRSLNGLHPETGSRSRFRVPYSRGRGHQHHKNHARYDRFISQVYFLSTTANVVRASARIFPGASQAQFAFVRLRQS